MPGNHDDLNIAVDCPACGCEHTELYGVLRTDPRLACCCGARFAVYLSGCPVENADFMLDLKDAGTNDNDVGPFADKSWGSLSAPGEGTNPC